MQQVENMLLPMIKSHEDQQNHETFLSIVWILHIKAQSTAYADSILSAINNSRDKSCAAMHAICSWLKKKKKMGDALLW